MPDIAQLFLKNRGLHDKNAKEWTGVFFFLFLFFCFRGWKEKFSFELSGLLEFRTEGSFGLRFRGEC